MPADKLFNYPYESFLMVRYEFILICEGNELEAKLLRIIESYVENARKALYRDAANTQSAPREAVIPIPRNIWVPISYKLFMRDLYGTVSSENTLKKGLKSLLEKRLIERRHTPQGRYDAPEYRLNVDALESLLATLREPGGQKLIPSRIDTLKQQGGQKLIPSGGQKLIPSVAGSSTTRGSKIDPILYREKKNKKEEESSSAVVSYATDCTPSPTSSIVAVEGQPSQQQQQHLPAPPIGLRMRQKGLKMPSLEEELGKTAPQGIPPLKIANSGYSEHSPEKAPLPEEERTSTSCSQLFPDLSSSTEQDEQKKQRKQKKTKKIEEEPLEPLVLTEEEQRQIAEEKRKEEERRERARQVYLQIVKRRGFELKEKGELINERKHIKLLLERYTPEEIDRIHVYLMDEDKFWSTVERRYAIGAHQIWKQSDMVLQILRAREAKAKAAQPQEATRPMPPKTIIKPGQLPDVVLEIKRRMARREAQEKAAQQKA